MRWRQPPGRRGLSSGRGEGPVREGSGGTPPLPLAVPGPAPGPGRTLAPAEVHRVLLHCALDAAGVRLTPADHAAVADIARLDFGVVDRVIGWLAAARSSCPEPGVRRQ
ncbi:hypothetical protein ACRAR1_28510 [Streptomyces sanyensis]|uniref:hypothetical protein n=1 Tax=Streptomyces sanyensis TaxID=568869 RepID=UPI003D76AD4D